MSKDIEPTPEERAALLHVTNNVGLHLELVINLTRESDNSKHIKLSYSLGMNTVPTAEDIDRVLIHAIEDANITEGVNDFRLVHLRDAGFARDTAVEWPPRPDMQRPTDIITKPGEAL